MTDRRCQSRTCRGETVPDVRLNDPAPARLGGTRAHGFVVEGALLCGKCARALDRPKRRRKERAA